MGTAPIACPALDALVTQGYPIVGVVTQPDRPAGRRLKLQPSAVKEAATRHRLPVLQPSRAGADEFVQTLKQLSPVLIIVIAYGQILPETVLSVPKLGCLNLHMSLLPRHRGAAPIQWAILNDDSDTGVTLMKMDRGLDTGDILMQTVTPILDEDDCTLLHDRLATLGAELLLQTLPDYVGGRIPGRVQDASAATYARKLEKEDGKILWNRPARQVWNQVRALNPWPGTFAVYSSQSLKILRARMDPGTGLPPGKIIEAGKEGIVVSCAEGSLRILEMQAPGGKPLSAGQFLAGHSMKAGDCFSSGLSS